MSFATELMSIDVTASGIHPEHPVDFRVESATGDPEYGLVFFDCAVVLDDHSGRSERPAGTAIFFGPRSPRYYHALRGPLIHTWILFDGPGVEQCLARYELPNYEAMYLGEIPFLETFIKDVRQERLQLAAFSKDAVTDLCHELFRRIGTLRSERPEGITAAQLRLTKQLKEARVHIHSDLARFWTVAEMAAVAGMNATRFAMDYTKLFGCSPLNDLIDARLRHAHNLLARFPYGLKRVATECGFRNVEHFVRIFHKRIGIPPGQVR